MLARKILTRIPSVCLQEQGVIHLSPWALQNQWLIQKRNNRHKSRGVLSANISGKTQSDYCEHSSLNLRAHGKGTAPEEMLNQTLNPRQGTYSIQPTFTQWGSTAPSRKSSLLSPLTILGLYRATEECMPVFLLNSIPDQGCGYTGHRVHGISYLGCTWGLQASMEE